MKNNARLLLIIIFFASFGGFLRLSYERYEPKEKYIYTDPAVNINNFVPNINTDNKESAHYAVPVLEIPSIGKKLRIDPITVDPNSDAKNWPISTVGVNILTHSGNLGDKQNVIIYGHNWTSILGNLKKIKIGDMIIVHLPPSQKLTYKVSNINIVLPNEKNLLQNHGKSELTIYTCTGFLDSHRLVITSRLEDPADAI